MATLTNSQVGVLGLSDGGFVRGSTATGTDTAMLSDTVTAVLGPAPPPTVKPLDLLGLTDTVQSFGYGEAGADALGLSDAATASLNNTLLRTTTGIVGVADNGYWLDTTETQIGLVGLSDAVSAVKTNQAQVTLDLLSLFDVATPDVRFVNTNDRVDLDLSIGASRLQRVLTVGPSQGRETVEVGGSLGSGLEVGGSRSGSIDVGVSQLDRTKKE